MRYSKKDLLDSLLNWAFVAVMCYVFYKAARGGDWMTLGFFAAIGVLVIGGATIRLRATTRQRLTTLAFGAGVSLNSAVAGYLVWETVRLSQSLKESGLIWVFGSLAITSVALLAFVLFHFWRYLRRTYGQQDAA